MECCGQKRTTKFCPDCGNELAASPGVSLLAHLRKTHERHLKIHKDNREYGKKKPLRLPEWIEWVEQRVKEQEEASDPQQGTP